MKKLLCFLLCSVLIFSSVSLCFAQDWSSSDSQNLQNVAGRLYYMNQSAAYYLYNIATNTNNIYNKCVDIYNTLFNNGHNITYWVHEIQSWMSPIYTAVTSIPTDLWVIQSLLGYPTTDSGGTTWHPYLSEIKNGTTETGVSIPYMTTDQNGNIIFDPSTTYYNWQVANIVGINNIMWEFAHHHNRIQYYFARLLNGETNTQNAVNWGNLQTSSFTPLSTTDGIYKWLSAIQAPVARLSYVLASDERIEAQEAAAANEEAVVDNFIDSNGDGAASPSDFGSVSGLSSGYKQNFATDASPSGIFDIFNSDHATWFSQETKDQLDTTTPSRMTKGSMSETPLLDKQIEDIYDALGVKQP